MSLLHVLSTSGSVVGCVDGERLRCGPPYGLSGWRQGRVAWMVRTKDACSALSGHRPPTRADRPLWRPAAPPLGAIQQSALWRSSALAIGRPAALAKVWSLVGGMADWNVGEGRCFVGWEKRLRDGFEVG